MNHIVLFEPSMPANTGNIARTATAINARLHLIKPLGFDLDDKKVVRAGLDYWKNVDITLHENLPAFLSTINNAQLFLVSKYAEKSYDQIDYSDSSQDRYFLFGNEAYGLPEIFMRRNPEKAIRIPQNDQHVRSLNLSNSVAIVLYEVLRQQNFIGLEREHLYEQDKLK
ncbi:tRNA (cytidine(34)-2'-O)-methyltransferase [Oenococcus kitaharae]|uniref:Putative tRNA (cytidine(34)-2'-O)-methyltransferase n=1 Tax=Oenococcus kitaharae DSM 17330 TaxID=1045004 RepID=G9WGY7_9LACO|nr:tRNA (cytidine(34)-2'-O)-methyltransferase [Oenococcus kitaharae]EHN59395.1 tRNA (cytosine34-2-O-)-methyltransferase [Oenococcus kitaharae DSM 17330]OEY83275.1 RNA methyltransferase [Oenococcus kitaharae]OEY85073.1 RNA methyltransferase [Oenococcus kitaharae]OEY85928.1 RNA methyltransferase [Oenococcus kitaharae]